MGQKRIQKCSTDELLSSLISMFVPSKILESFEVWKVHKQPKSWTIELREKESLIPQSLLPEKGKAMELVVLDGFCNPVELLSLGFSQGPVYLRLYRRRWKRSNEDEHFSNQYDFKLSGYKMVPGLGDFFKRKIEASPINITTVANMFDLKPKHLYEVYRFVLSGYEEEKTKGTWGDKKVDKVDIETGEVVGERTVYIAAPKNVGPFMCLDDKVINGKPFSILSNRWTGLIALMVDTTKSLELQKAVKFLSEVIHKVKTINCDMAPSYLNFIREAFPNVTVVVDKFHVMKYVYGSVQNVRLEIKSDILEKLPKGKRNETDEKILTDLEQLKKAKTPLSRSRVKWSEDQAELMTNLFKKYPTLERAYDLAQDFKKWYDKKNVKKGFLDIERGIDQWIEDVEISGIKKFSSCSKMIQKHKTQIMNFFSNAQTNARAERLNGAIERFLSASYGTKDLDFTLYRIKGYFS